MAVLRWGRGLLLDTWDGVDVLSKRAVNHLSQEVALIIRDSRGRHFTSQLSHLTRSRCHSPLRSFRLVTGSSCRSDGSGRKSYNRLGHIILDVPMRRSYLR